MSNQVDQASAIQVSVHHSPLGSHELRRFRLRLQENQETFWARFGVTQSSGSRFESGTCMPSPLAILVRLYVNGEINENSLAYKK